MLVFQSPFSGDFLCFPNALLSVDTDKIVIFQSPFSGDFLCFQNKRRTNYNEKRNLSISIFRRFSLFREIPKNLPKNVLEAFNLHFQEIFFVSSKELQRVVLREEGSFNLHFQEIFFVSLEYPGKAKCLQCGFQSPFSGDFLCFPQTIRAAGSTVLVFQSPFSGDFLCFLTDSEDCSVRRITIFQSPFSGDFLCFLTSTTCLQRAQWTFNLHFQEIFFVSFSIFNYLFW